MTKQGQYFLVWEGKNGVSSFQSYLFSPSALTFYPGGMSSLSVKLTKCPQKLSYRKKNVEGRGAVVLSFLL